ncbi:NUDIX hydrolase [Motilimonas pumila]|uniref:NUDIX hydrolase n=1 Tax=Motilimonas pumila TaxID=2303987 RepID=UPI001E44F759|nr:NUDIX domain-containing protein [Motilimonas pumila]
MSETEQSYLNNYNIHDFDVPLTTVDSVLFTVQDGQLFTLLVQRANHPAKGMWGLPGGFVDTQQDTDLDHCAQRHLQQKTGIEAPFLQPLVALGNGQRDPRGWSTSISFYALMAHADCQHYVDTVSDVQWFPLAQAQQMSLAFDHTKILDLALKQLQQKALDSLVLAYALPETFTLTQLQHLHEVILGRSIQSKSFRRRIEQAQVLQDTGEVSDTQGKGKRPSLYRLKPDIAEYRFVRNLEA